MSFSIQRSNSITATQIQLQGSQQAAQIVSTPNSWKKRDSLRSRDTKSRGNEIEKTKGKDSDRRSDSCKPPLAFLKPQNGNRYYFFPSPPLQTTLMYFDSSSFNGSTENRKITSASGCQRKKVNQYKVEDQNDLYMKNKQIGDNEFELSSCQVKNKCNAFNNNTPANTISRKMNNIKCIKGDKFLSIKDTIAAYREVEQVLIIQNSESTSKPPLYISANSNDKSLPISSSIKHCSSEEKLRLVESEGVGGLMAKKYKKILQNYQSPISNALCGKDKENREYTSSTASVTPFQKAPQTHLASPFVGVTPPHVNNINAFRIKKANGHYRMNQNDEGQNSLYLDSKASLRNNGLIGDKSLDFQDGLSISKPPQIKKITSPHKDHHSKILFLKQQREEKEKKSRQASHSDVSDMYNQKRCSGSYSFIQLEPSLREDKEITQYYQKGIESENSTTMFNQDFHISSQQNNWMEEEDSSIEDTQFQINQQTTNSLISKINCSQVRRILLRQPVDQLKKIRECNNLKSLIIIKAENLLFGNLTSLSFWEGYSFSQMEQFVSKLVDLKKNLRILSRSYLIFFLFQSSSKRVLDLINILQKQLFNFDGVYYCQGTQNSIYENKAINVNIILNDFDITHPKQLILFDSLPVDFPLIPTQKHHDGQDINSFQCQNILNLTNQPTFNHSSAHSEDIKSFGILNKQSHYDNLSEWIPQVEESLLKKTKIILLRQKGKQNQIFLNQKKITEISLHLADSQNQSSNFKLMEVDINDYLSRAIEENKDQTAKDAFLRAVIKIKQSNKNNKEEAPQDPNKVAENFRNRLIEYMKSTQKSISCLYYSVGDLVMRNRQIFANFCQEPFHIKAKITDNLELLDLLRYANLPTTQKSSPVRNKQGKKQDLPDENPYDILLERDTDKKVEEQQVGYNLPLKVYLYVDPFY